MKAKHYVAFLIVLGSLFYFAMMTTSHIQTLTTPHARFLFIMPFAIALFSGVAALCFLFSQINFRKN